MKVTVEQAEVLITSCMKRGKPVTLLGPAGCAKTALFMQVAKKLGYHCLVFHPVTSDPTDFKGFPWISEDKQSADFVPFGEFGRLLSATEPTLAFFDDLGHATKAVQGTLMQPVHKRTLNGHVIPECVRFGFASNRREDKAGVEGIIEPLLSRCHGVFDIVPDTDSFAAWWMRENKPQEVIGFLKFRPEFLYSTDKKHAMYNFPCFRTWEAVGDWLAADLPASLEKTAYCGAVGEGAGTEFFAYLKIYREIPDVDEALANPDKAPIPTNASILWAFTTAFAYRASRKTFPSIATYIDRLAKANKEEQAVYLFKGAYTRCKEIERAAEFSKLASSRIGKLITPSGE